ncbi:MAG: neuraminidase-like domain-containing protein [Pyrinomonadaceae bacterium]
MLKRLGASADQCLSWARRSPTGDDARELMSVVRAKYDAAQWLDVAKALRDSLRERQRSALVAYLVQTLGVRDADELYERFLIDVEMSSCMMTTRIKQAISAVQLFIQRCLMNLESDVSLTPVEAKEWAQWRKWYRVWEANRKVLLYPENWIEPELRDDKSPFYKELESELLQSDVTMATAEDAFLHYLEKLDQVARLEIAGMYLQKEQSQPDVLHVFGRTYAIPYSYFYRRQADKVWSAWEKLDLDIEGDHLIPIAWNRRLYLFWAIFTEKSEQLTKKQRENDDDPHKYWEIKLARSEYKNKSWSPKKVSKETLRHDKYPYPPPLNGPADLPSIVSQHPPLVVPQEPQDFSFKTRILEGLAGEQLSIACYGTIVRQGDPTTRLVNAGSPAITVNRQLMVSISQPDVIAANVNGVLPWYINIGFYLGTSSPTPVEGSEN